MSIVAAERIWFAIAPDGSEHELVLRVYVPTLKSGGDWSSEVSLGILHSKSHFISGVDAWQAVELGMQFVSMRVGHFAQDGWQFFWGRGGEPAKASHLTHVE